MLNPIEKFKRSILHLNRSLHHWYLYGPPFTHDKKICWPLEKNLVPLRPPQTILPPPQIERPPPGKK